MSPTLLVCKKRDGLWISCKLCGGGAPPEPSPTYPSWPRHLSGRAGGCLRRRGATPARGSRELRAKPPAAPLPRNRPGRGTSSGAQSPGTSDPPPEVAGGRAKLGNVRGRGGQWPTEPWPCRTSPLGRSTRGATARPAKALGFRLPPGLLNFSGRKSHPRWRHRAGRCLGPRFGIAGLGGNC